MFATSDPFPIGAMFEFFPRDAFEHDRCREPRMRATFLDLEEATSMRQAAGAAAFTSALAPSA